MSLYRYAVRNGVLIREKRKLLRWWIWSFNRSEEDYINRMKNRLQACRAEQAVLMKKLPEHTERIGKVKDALSADGNESRAYRDSWSARKEPVRLELDIKKPKKKDKSDGKAQPTTLARIVAGPDK